MLCIPKLQTKTFGHRSFSFAAPTIWNSLPSELRHTNSSKKFKLALKCHLFLKFCTWHSKNFYFDLNHNIWSTSTCVRMHDYERLTCENYYFISLIYTFLLLLLWSIRLHVPVSVRVYDWLLDRNNMHIFLLYCVFNMLNFMCLFIIMSISAKRHKLWCTVGYMRLSKCSIIIIIIMWKEMQ